MSVVRVTQMRTYQQSEEEIKDILEKEGIRDFQQDIREMTKKELRKNFAFKANRKVNVTNLVKNLIWQAYTWVKSGKMKPIEGNLRSFWYKNVKSVLSRLDLDVSGEEHVEKIYDAFVELVTVYRLFRYADFGFIDGGQGRRILGSRNGHLVLFVEKDGLSSVVKSIAKFYKATVVILRGFSSYIETEFLVRKMAKKGLLKVPVHIFSMVDYDPSGYWIEREFVKQVKSYNVEVGDVHSIISPKGIPHEKLEIYKFKLKAGPKTTNWLQITGGIGGEPYGLQADAFEVNDIREAYAKALGPYLKSFGVRKGFRVQRHDEERSRFFKTLAAPSAFEI
jgi:hypothetical protein